jgi:hypothetical protein
MTTQHFQPSHGERPAQKAAPAARSLVPITFLLMTTLVLGCADNITRAVEEHPAPGVSGAATAAADKGGPANSGVLARFTFPDDEICGISVTTDLFLAGAEWEPAFPGHPPLKATGTLRLTWTTADGKSLQLHSAGNTVREITEWIDENTFRATETSTGLRDALSTPQGLVFLRDVGRIVIGSLVELQEDGGFLILETEILEVSGPHPHAESGFTLLCAAVTSVLS